MTRNTLMYLSLISLLNLTFSCKSKTETIEPFKITLIDYDYSQAYSIKYVLTDKKIDISLDDELRNSKDSIFYSKNLKIDNQLNEISTINFYKLKNEYTNKCIEDGSQIFLNYLKGDEIKKIYLSNYYVDEIGSLINYINGIVPEDLGIWYDKKEFGQDMFGCQ